MSSHWISLLLKFTLLLHLMVMATARVLQRGQIGHTFSGASQPTSTTTRTLAFSSPFFPSPASRARRTKPGQPQHLVLVGGGHAHVQVIKALNTASRPKNLQVTLIDLQKSASYSGMVPACIAGKYAPEETLLHLEPLADWAGINFVNGRVVDIDPNSNQIRIEGKDGPIEFDALSIDIGSTSRGLDVTKGAREFSIPTRPIAALVARLEEATAQLTEMEAPIEIVVIGAGAAGIELSMSIAGRWEPVVGKENLRVTLLNADSELLPNETESNRDALLKVLNERNISVRNDCTVQEVKETSVCVKQVRGVDDTIPFSHCVWATGAGAHDLALRLGKRGLATSKHGWIQVNEHLQSISHPCIFAAGDCCTIERLPNGSPPKAGVYAVRSGPILIENLTKILESQREENGDNMPQLVRYEPQVDFLKLLVCGDGTALGFRFGITIRGKWVFQMKDAIDKGFVDIFKVENLPLPKEGQPHDTSQYDAAGDRPPPTDATDAARLIRRTDDDVDYKAAWNVLRDMTHDEAYRREVLECISVEMPNLL